MCSGVFHREPVEGCHQCAAERLRKVAVCMRTLGMAPSKAGDFEYFVDGNVGVGGHHGTCGSGVVKNVFRSSTKTTPKSILEGIWGFEIGLTENCSKILKRFLLPVSSKMQVSRLLLVKTLQNERKRKLGFRIWGPTCPTRNTHPAH